MNLCELLNVMSGNTSVLIRDPEEHIDLYQGLVKNLHCDTTGMTVIEIAPATEETLISVKGSEQ